MSSEPGNFRLRRCSGTIEGWNFRFGEWFRTPAPLEPVVHDALAGVRKPPKEETAGRMGLCAGAPYGDLKVVDGARASALEREADSRGARDEDEELI